MMNKIKRIIKKINNKVIGSVRRNILLKNKNFSIISNNCFGGDVYQSYNMPYLSPTIGLFFFADEYIKFLTNLKFNLESEIDFIKHEESKYYHLFNDYGIKPHVPIGIVNDVEIVFLHYNNDEQARKKWKLKSQRVNYDNLILKFNDQNEFNRSLLEAFIELPFKNKIFITSDNSLVSKFTVFIKGDKTGKYRDTTWRYYNKYLKTTKYLNRLIEEREK